MCHKTMEDKEIMLGVVLIFSTTFLLLVLRHLMLDPSSCTPLADVYRGYTYSILDTVFLPVKKILVCIKEVSCFLIYCAGNFIEKYNILFHSSFQFIKRIIANKISNCSFTLFCKVPGWAMMRFL